MARRLILGKRGTAYGIFVSKPGFDVATASEANLLFSSSRRHGMLVGSGGFVCPANGAGLFVSFPNPVVSTPLLFCGRLTQFPSDVPVNAVVTTSGFTVRARQMPDGSFPASGVAMTYVAMMKNQDG